MLSKKKTICRKKIFWGVIPRITSSRLKRDAVDQTKSSPSPSSFFIFAFSIASLASTARRIVLPRRGLHENRRAAHHTKRKGCNVDTFWML